MSNITGGGYAGGNEYNGAGFMVDDLYFVVNIADATAAVPLMTGVGQYIFALLAGLGGIYTIIRAKSRKSC
ncbi:MAG: hypothetical protein HQL01_05575 [Nitrospirae bacterium]|nr:hypothetical protein [Nitrospirota bacterium]